MGNEKTSSGIGDPSRAGGTLPVDPGARGGWKYLRTRDLRRLHNLELAAKLIVEGFYQGHHRSPYHDFSSEFADYRAYAPGDEIRAIDWRAYARSDRYYIKLYRKETDMTCHVVVDSSRSMAYQGADGTSKWEYAAYMAAALAYLVVRQTDKIGLTIAGDQPASPSRQAVADTQEGPSGGIRHVAAGSTRRTLQRILLTLEQTTPAGRSDLPATLRTLFGAVRRRGLLIVISDFLDDVDELFSALGMYIHRGYSVLLMHVLTDEEIELPSIENALFQDMETPDSLAVEPAAIRDAYQAEIAAYLADIAARATARRIHYHLAKTSTPYHTALEAYLTSRARQ